MIKDVTQKIRHWINLLNESYFDTTVFTNYEFDSLERFGYPLLGAIESINDPFVTPEELEDIKYFLEVLLMDGGLWGETLNSHDVKTSRLKQKIINLKNSLD